MFDKELLFKILKKEQVTFIQLARKLQISRSQNREFSKKLLSLINQKKIFTNTKNEFYIPNFIDEIEGKIRVNSKGFGFVDIEKQDSIFIAPTNINTAMNEDIVKIKIFNDLDKPGQKQGVVLEILQRNREIFVGTVKMFGNKMGLIPLDAKIKGKFRFEDEKDLKIDYQVKIEIIKYEFNYIIVKCLKILGHKDEISMDIQSVIEDYNIDYLFKKNTLLEANKIPQTIENENIKKRKDLRDRLIVTIDGDDTKDFDDAIEVSKLKNGNYLLGVHIADVAYYVKEDSFLDKEAQERGTSIYLVDRVIPMLPSTLSNGICSLNPNVDRFVLSVDIEINNQGKTVNCSIYSGIINSKYRLTYKDVNNFYNGNKTFVDKKLENMLNISFDLSKIIRKFKEQEGYIDFEIKESKIIIDKNGKTQEIITKERGMSEIMIEDFMVRANETIANYVDDNKLPFIYRVHAKPETKKLITLQNVVDILGIKVKIPLQASSKQFSQIANIIKASRFDDFVKIMMLRTMSKAVYTHENIGHFGLASQSYTHFTSPIRRYPDLVVHRMLRTYFFQKNLNIANHFLNILPTIAERSSQAEQRAIELERRVADIKKTEFFEKFIGQKFKGQIVSTQKFGFFVEFSNKISGFVHFWTILDGKYELENNTFQISNGKRTFKIGDTIEVVIYKTRKYEGRIDLVLSEFYLEIKKQSNKYRHLS